MREHNIVTLFVRDGGRIGIVSWTDLGEAAILKRLPLETPVREISISMSPRWNRTTSCSRRSSP